MHRCWIPYGNISGRDTLRHHGARTNLGASTYRDTAQNDGASTNFDIVLDHGARARNSLVANGDVLADAHIVANYALIIDYYAYTVVDAKWYPDLGPPGNFDAEHPFDEDPVN